MISGLIVSNYIDTPSHFQSKKTLSQWLKEKGVPALEIKDTRYLTQKIRDEGVSLSKIIFDRDIDFYDPNTENLVEQVSSKKINLLKARNSNRTILLIDCGTKRNIQKALLKAGVNVLTIPWDFDPFEQKEIETIKKLLPNQKKLFDGIVVSNGPGDPKFVSKTIQTIQKSMKRELPTLGICLGHQLLALAAGGTTKKLKYGHRSQNQPCVMEDSNRCFITTQNHGFAVDKIPSGFKKWFTNANDKTNEGLIHKRFPFMSVQFHPEATPGPEDADWIFDYFLKHI